MIEFTDRNGRDWVVGAKSPHYYHTTEAGRDELFRLLQLVPAREFIRAPVISRLQHIDHSEV